MSTSGGGNMPRLGPAWRSSATGASRGFQPPPAVPDERASSRERSGSHASAGSGGASGGEGGGGNKNRNPFAMLDDEDEGGGRSTNADNSSAGPSGNSGGGGGRFGSLRSDNNQSSSSSSRPYNRAASTGASAPSAGASAGGGAARPGGRSLADLAAKLKPEDRADAHHGGHHGPHHSHRDPRSLPRSSSTGVAPSRNRSGSGEGAAAHRGDRDDRVGRDEGGTAGGGAHDAESGSGAKAIRYTREKLLSLRGRGDDEPPECFAELEGSVVISTVPQDPVCWDTFDSDEVWANVGRERRTSDRPVPKGPERGRLRDFDSGDEGGGPPQRGSLGGRPGMQERGSMQEPRGSTDGPPPHRGSLDERRPSGGGGGFGSGRWQRGVAVPEGDARPSSSGRDRPSDRSSLSRNNPDFEANNPDDLWDDPAPVGSGGTGAASDFSAFGGSLDDDHPKGKTGMSAFELSDISKAAAAFENELHGDRKSDNGSDAEGALEGGALEEGEGALEDGALEDGDDTYHAVDATRPLASTGTTIRSGSGDDVNVFEDFGDDEPAAAATSGSEGEEEELPIKSGNEENNASSRLMKMIGVAGTGEASGGLGEPTETSEPKPDGSNPEEETNSADGAAASISSNPWGAPPPSFVSSNPWGDAPSGGGAVDPFASQQAKDAEAKAQRQREEELRLKQQQQAAEEEEKTRWAAMQAKQQAEMQAAQQRQQDQVKAQQNQVELVLIERISNILENSWGRSDLNSILSTLHANDSRVIAILSTAEALRALIARHPVRIQLGRDPTMGAEMAALRLTNAQFQAHQAQQAQVAAAQQAQQQAQQVQQDEIKRRRQLQEEQARQQQQEAMARAQAEERNKQQAAAQAPAAPVVTDAPWFYADPQGNIQGPFGGDEMRQWLEAGYFKGDLPISQNTSGPFRRLNTYFSDASTAFQPTKPSGEDKAAAEAKARAEAAARAQAGAKARAEVEAAAAHEKAAAEEAAARAAEAARAEAESNARAEAEANAEKAAAVEQSAQLKMMLGLGAGSSDGGGVTIAGLPQPEPVPLAAASEQPKPAAQPAPAKKQSKKAQKQKEQQQQQPAAVSEPVPVAQPPTVPEPAPAAPPAPAWGGAARPAAATRKKSMSEIQQEEAREASRRAKEQGITVVGGGGGQRSGAGGWANIAATGGTTAWGGAVAKTPAAVVTPAPVVVGGLAPQKAGAWSMPTTAPATAAAAGKKQAQPKSAAGAAAAAGPSKKAAADNFGANGRMTPSLETWCKEQMQKLNGSDDLTLVSFCMTLTDRDEIRQYLTAYLGSTPQVNNFATEFIKRKGLGDNGRDEEWETTGGPKKGRKKKGGK